MTDSSMSHPSTRDTTILAGVSHLNYKSLSSLETMTNITESGDACHCLRMADTVSSDVDEVRSILKGTPAVL
jgi:hypothetical protein